LDALDQHLFQRDALSPKIRPNGIGGGPDTSLCRRRQAEIEEGSEAGNIAAKGSAILETAEEMDGELTLRSQCRARVFSPCLDGLDLVVFFRVGFIDHLLDVLLLRFDAEVSRLEIQQMEQEIV
jgi:hypothetical protein